MTRAVADAVAEAAVPLYVGFSGGRDSTVLLHAAAALRRADVTAVHVHHGLHPQADAWHAHCAKVAFRLEIGFVGRRVSVSARGSLEAAARAARYRVFLELVAESGGTLLLAHHRHDQSETILLRLLQGRGLYGMPSRRPLGAGVLVRPLLGFDPDTLDAYARRHALAWVDDPGNADERLDRNYLRHRVLPPLRSRFAGVDQALLEAAARQTLIDGGLREALRGLPPGAPLPLATLMNRPAAEAHTLLRLWLGAQGARAPSRRALAELLRQALESRDGAEPRLDAGNLRVRVHAGVLHAVRTPPRLAAEYPVTIPGITELPHGVLEVREDPAGFQPVGPVTVRFRRGGEHVRVGGHRRRLKRLLQESGVLPWERDMLPLLFDEAGLLAVPGVAQRDRDAAGPGWRVTWRPHRRPESAGMEAIP